MHFMKGVAVQHAWVNSQHGTTLGAEKRPWHSQQNMVCLFQNNWHAPGLSQGPNPGPVTLGGHASRLAHHELDPVRSTEGPAQTGPAKLYPKMEVLNLGWKVSRTEGLSRLSGPRWPQCCCSRAPPFVPIHDSMGDLPVSWRRKEKPNLWMYLWVQGKSRQQSPSMFIWEWLWIKVPREICLIRSVLTANPVTSLWKEKWFQRIHMEP